MRRDQQNIRVQHCETFCDKETEARRNATMLTKALYDNDLQSFLTTIIVKETKQ